MTRRTLVAACADYIKDQPETQYGRDNIPDDAKGGKSEQQGADTRGDDHGGAYNHGSDNDAESQSVKNMIKGMSHAI